MKLSEIHWLLRLLGVDTSSIPGDPQVQISWLRMPESLGVFVLIVIVLAAMYGVFWLYRREIDACPRWVKRVLAVTRILVLLILVVVYLYPVLTYTKRRTLRPQVIVLRDASQSMNSADRYLEDQAAQIVADASGGTIESIREKRPTRASLVNELTAGERDFVSRLAERGKLKVFDFAAATKPLAVETRQPDEASDGAEQGTPVAALPELAADGQSSDLFKAVLDALQEKLVAAVVVFSDGQHTGQGTLAEAGRKAKEVGVPLLVVGVGDPAKPRNLEVSDVYADPQVWRNDPFEIQAVLRSQGVGGESVEVRLLEIQELGDGQPPTENVLERRTIQLAGGGGHLQLTFQHTPKTSGRKAYNVEVEAIDNESNPDDNRPAAPVEVKVLSEQARVLLVAGAPSWEYRGVQRLLTRERSVNLSCWLQTLDDGRPQEGDTPITLLPATREALFKYDVIMLFDPDPKEFDQAWIELLKEFVSEHAGGVLYMAGPKFSGRFLAGSRTGSLTGLLPVRLGDTAALEVDALLSSNSQSWPLGVVAANVDEPIMRFYAEPERTLARWESLPGIFWSFPSEGPKPGSRVLIEHTNQAFQYAPRPLLVTGQYGSGRTVYLGFNGTWRWRRMGRNAEFFNRFWIQTTRYLVEGRTLEGKRRGVVETDRFRYSLGDRATITARLKDSSYKPLEKDEVTAQLRVGREQASLVKLRAVPNQPGQYETTLTLRETGRHVLLLDLVDDVSDPVTLETTFTVSVPSVETEEIWLNKQGLVELASESGGQYFEINEVSNIPAAIPDKTQTIEISSSPIPLWDKDWVLVLLVGLLGAEWALRKRFKLL